MPIATKQQINEAADWCDEQAQASLDRGLDFAAQASGPVSAQADFERAGSLLSAANALREIAKKAPKDPADAN